MPDTGSQWGKKLGKGEWEREKKGARRALRLLNTLISKIRCEIPPFLAGLNTLISKIRCEIPPFLAGLNTLNVNHQI
jgi:hypothetical protein